MNRVVVTRGALRTWLLALAGVPLVLLGYEGLTGGGWLERFWQAVYRGSPPTPEARDVIWAVSFLIGGAVLVGWGVKELMRPTVLAEADADGMRLRIGPPGSRPPAISWDEVIDVRWGPMEGPGSPVPSLVLVVKDPARLPREPWGARWVDRWTLMVPAGSWSPPVEAVLERLEAIRAVRP